MKQEPGDVLKSRTDVGTEQSRRDVLWLEQEIAHEGASLAGETDVRELGSVDPTELKITSVIEKEGGPVGSGKPIVKVRHRRSEMTRFHVRAERESAGVAEFSLQRLAMVLDVLVRVHDAVRTETEMKSGGKGAGSESVGDLVGTSSSSFCHGTHLSTKVVCGHCQGDRSERLHGARDEQGVESTKGVVSVTISSNGCEKETMLGSPSKSSPAWRVLAYPR